MVIKKTLWMTLTLALLIPMIATAASAVNISDELLYQYNGTSPDGGVESVVFSDGLTPNRLLTLGWDAGSSKSYYHIDGSNSSRALIETEEWMGFAMASFSSTASHFVINNDTDLLVFDRVAYEEETYPNNLSLLSENPSYVTVLEHPDPNYGFNNEGATSWNPDDTLMAVSAVTSPIGSDNSQVLIYDTSNWSVVHTIEHPHTSGDGLSLTHLSYNGGFSFINGGDHFVLLESVNESQATGTEYVEIVLFETVNWTELDRYPVVGASDADRTAKLEDVDETNQELLLTTTIGSNLRVEIVSYADNNLTYVMNNAVSDWDSDAGVHKSIARYDDTKELFFVAAGNETGIKVFEVSTFKEEELAAAQIPEVLYEIETEHSSLQTLDVSSEGLLTYAPQWDSGQEVTTLQITIEEETSPLGLFSLMSSALVIFLWIIVFGIISGMVSETAGGDHKKMRNVLLVAFLFIVATALMLAMGHFLT